MEEKMEGGAIERKSESQAEQPNLIPASVFSALPIIVRAEMAKSTPARQAQFLEEYQRKRKSTGIAYLLWFLLGWHYAYLGKWGTQVLFWITFGGITVWWIVDVFRVSGMVRDRNKNVATAVLRDMAIIWGHS